MVLAVNCQPPSLRGRLGKLSLSLPLPDLIRDSSGTPLRLLLDSSGTPPGPPGTHANPLCVNNCFCNKKENAKQSPAHKTQDHTLAPWKAGKYNRNGAENQSDALVSCTHLSPLAHLKLGNPEQPRRSLRLLPCTLRLRNHNRKCISIAVCHFYNEQNNCTLASRHQQNARN